MIRKKSAPNRSLGGHRLEINNFIDHTSTVAVNTTRILDSPLSKKIIESDQVICINDYDDESVSKPTLIKNRPNQINQQLIRIDNISECHSQANATSSALNYQILGARSYTIEDDSYDLEHDYQSTEVSVFIKGAMLVLQLTHGIQSEYLYSATLLRELKHSINNKFLKINGAWDSNMNNIKLTISILFDNTNTNPIYFSHKLLLWCIEQNTIKPNWLMNTEASFDVADFLHKSSTQALNCCTQNIPKEYLMKLNTLLYENGLKTRLRNYQLQGVYWMFSQLTNHFDLFDNNKDDITTIANDSNSYRNNNEGYSGWLCIPLIYHTNNNSITNSSISGNTSISMYYNIVTTELCLHPFNSPLTESQSSDFTLSRPSSSSSSQQPSQSSITREKEKSGNGHGNQSTRRGTSLLLADEMGMGKSIQILALVLLLKYYNKIYNIEKSISSKSLQCLNTNANNSDNNNPTTNNNSDNSNVRDEKSICLCGRSTFIKKRDFCWIECNLCQRWLHASCCGFSSQQEADETIEFICISCKCQYYAHKRNKIRSLATIIIVPSTLITQWVGEINKHCHGFVNFNLKSAATSTTSYVNNNSNNKDSANNNNDNTVDCSNKNNAYNTSNNTNINNHTTTPPPTPPSTLSVFVYEGMDAQEMTKHSVHYKYSDFDPVLLCQYDIILVSLKALQKDYYLYKATTDPITTTSSNSNNNNNQENEKLLLFQSQSPSKRPKRSSTTSNTPNSTTNTTATTTSIYYPPPLFCLSYQLLIIDETQKIESENRENQAFTMTNAFTSLYRISVSGTPLGNEKISDLRSLTQFLRLLPYTEDDVYNMQLHWKYIYQNTGGSHNNTTNSNNNTLIKNEKLRNEWLVQLYSGIVLRRTKNMVSDQIGLQKQLEFVSVLEFTDFEVCISIRISGYLIFTYIHF